MNRLIKAFSILFIMTVVNGYSKSEKKWYSPLDPGILVRENERFEESLSGINQKLLRSLGEFDAALINKNYDTLYSYRDKAYQDIVSRMIFEKNVHSGSNTPVAIYRSLRHSEIGSGRAAIKTYYVQEAKEFQYVVESIDNWKYEEDSGLWVFVSNLLSWGSPFGD